MINKVQAINRFYRSQIWQQVRLQKITEANGRCEKCGGVGEEVHHIVSLTALNVNDPNITLNQRNLILLCRECHNKEHERFGRRQRFDLEGNLIDNTSGNLCE